jgi:phage tail sheath protein FI
MRMPGPLFPGGYVEELPPGPHAIEPVSTSVTAFIGRATLGPVNLPVPLTSWGEFEDRFGGLASDCSMSYAVRDFFLNGGTDALAVRIAPRDASCGMIAVPSADQAEPLVLEARSPGSWSRQLTITIDHKAPDPAIGDGLLPAPRFNLTVAYAGSKIGAGAGQERFADVSADPGSPRFARLVLDSASRFVRTRSIPLDRPRPGDYVQEWTAGADGGDLTDTDLVGDTAIGTGLHSLRDAGSFNILCIPPPVRSGATGTSVAPSAVVWRTAAEFCVSERAFLIIDPDPGWAAASAGAVERCRAGSGALGLLGPAASHAALYVPCIREADPLEGGQLRDFAPCGALAGLFARTDATRGVWKAPAGVDASLLNVTSLQAEFDASEMGLLNAQGIDCLRTLPSRSRVAWGARTLAGGNPDDYKYVPVRRLQLFIEASLDRGLKWAVFEPSGESLWAQIRSAVENFLEGLFRAGAFQGAQPRDAYFVKCDGETTTASDIAAGVTNVIVGFAPTKPAEFLILEVQLRASSPSNP